MDALGQHLSVKCTRFGAAQARVSPVDGDDLTPVEALFAVVISQSKLRDHMGLPRPKTVAGWEVGRTQGEVSAVVNAFLDELDVAFANQASERAQTLPPQPPPDPPVDP